MRVTVDPSVVLLVVVSAAAYGRGAIRARGTRGTSRIATRGRMVAFAAGLAVVAVALLSPIDAIAEELFAVHMVQHILLALVAPLLLVLGAPVAVMSHLLAVPARRSLWRWGDRASARLGLRRSAGLVGLGAVAVHALVLWSWHVPPLYDAAVADDRLHLLEHATLIGGGAVLWWAVIARPPRRRSGAPIVFLFLAGLMAGALAALLTLAPAPLYTAHAETTTGWGLTPLEDQQLAGAIMWVPGGFVYLVSAVCLLVRWLQAPAPPPPFLHVVQPPLERAP